MNRKLQRILATMLAALLAIPAILLVPTPTQANLGTNLYVFDLDGYYSNADRADWYDLSLFVATLQGVVNQDGPRLYIRQFQYGRPFAQGITSSATADVNSGWLDKFRARGGWLSGANVVELETVDDLIAVFGNDLEGVIVWDPKVEATVNVATTMAGIERAPIVMASGALYGQVTAAPNSLAVVADLNDQFSGPDAKIDAYEWAKANYLDNGKANPAVLAYIEDGYVRQPGTASAQNYAVERDYVVKNKGFAFDLTPHGDEAPNDAPEQTLGEDRRMLLDILQAAYSRWGVHSPIELYGFFPWWDKYSTHGDRSLHDPVSGEMLSVEEFSKYNVHITSIMDTIGYGNASFHSWAPVGKALAGAPEAPERQAIGNKTYVLYYMADHDGGTMHQMPYLWDDSRRGEVPLAWGVVPNMFRDYPDIAQYLYDTATPNDYFVGGASGAGYANPSYLPDLEAWTRWNEFLYQRTGYTTTGFLLNGNGLEVSDAVEQAYSRFSADGLIGFESSIRGTGPYVRNGNMAVAEIKAHVGGGDIIAAANQIHAYAAGLDNIGSQPNFIAVRVPFAYPKQIELIQQQLEADYPSRNYEAIDPYSFFSFIRQSVANKALDSVTVAVDLPDRMVAGESYDAAVTVRNTGSSTWTFGTNDRLGAGASNSFAWSNLNGGYSNALTDQRVFLESGASVAPQSTHTFRFTVTAPAIAGTYTFASFMVRDGVAAMGEAYERPVQVVAASGDQAIATSVILPDELEEGELATVEITLKNVGSTTWTEAAGYRLASLANGHLPIMGWQPNRMEWTDFTDGGYSLSIFDQRVFLADTDAIAPGQSKTFVFRVKAPDQRGKYVFTSQLIRDGAGGGLFGSVVEEEITVVPAGRQSLDAALIGSNVPAYMGLGERKRVTISVRNTGTDVWSESGQYRLAAASGNGFAFSDFADGGYSGSLVDQQAYLGAAEQIAGEGSKSFTFDITAPATPGTYTLAVDMIQDGVASANQVMSWEIVIAGDYAASFPAWNIPGRMAAGSTAFVSIEVLNEGQLPWTKGDLYRIWFTDNNQFRVVGFGTTGGYGAGPDEQRLFLRDTDHIIQGQREQYDIHIQAPDLPGNYTMEFRMIRDGVAPFGETVTIPIEVVDAYVERVNVGGSAYTDAAGTGWSADAPYSSAAGWGYIGTSSTAVTSNPVQPGNTGMDASMLQSARHGANFGYQFDVPNGDYEVTLAFAEIAKFQSGTRYFALDAEGVNVLSGFDIYKMVYSASSATGANRGLRYSFVAHVADGQLNLAFLGQLDNALLNAVIVQRIN